VQDQDRSGTNSALWFLIIIECYTNTLTYLLTTAAAGVNVAWLERKRQWQWHYFQQSSLTADTGYVTSHGQTTADSQLGDKAYNFTHVSMTVSLLGKFMGVTRPRVDCSRVGLSARCPATTTAQVPGYWRQGDDARLVRSTGSRKGPHTAWSQTTVVAVRQVEAEAPRTCPTDIPSRTATAAPVCTCAAVSLLRLKFENQK